MRVKISDLLVQELKSRLVGDLTKSMHLLTRVAISAYYFPLGAEVNFTFVTVATQLTLSEKHTISEDMHVNMTAAYSLVIGGSVDMNRVGNQYDIGIVDFRPIEVVATSDEHSGDYVFEVDPDGRFSGKIVPGNWTLSVFDERLNAEALIVDHQGDNESYDIMTYPENITVAGSSLYLITRWMETSQMALCVL